MLARKRRRRGREGLWGGGQTCFEVTLSNVLCPTNNPKPKEFALQRSKTDKIANPFIWAVGKSKWFPFLLWLMKRLSNFYWWLLAKKCYTVIHYTYRIYMQWIPVKTTFLNLFFCQIYYCLCCFNCSWCPTSYSVAFLSVNSITVCCCSYIISHSGSIKCNLILLGYIVLKRGQYSPLKDK